MKLFKDIFISHSGEYLNKKLEKFYIDENGIKYGFQKNESDQVVNCSFNDVLIKEDGIWRIKNTKDEYLEKYQNVDKSRQAAYTERVSPLLEEAEIKSHLGDEGEYIRLMDLAVQERLKIQLENPWPENIADTSND